MTKRHRAFLALCRTTLMAGLALIFTGCQFFSPDGLYIRDYDPARHDRFYEGADRVFLGEIYNWSGVGVVREDGEIEAWATMVAAQYFLSAHHRHPEPGDVLTFWEGNDPAGPRHEYLVDNWSLVPTCDGHDTDLYLGRLAEPIPPEHHIAFYTVLDLGSDDAYPGLDIFVYGAPGRLGINQIDRINKVSRGDWLFPVFEFGYNPCGGAGGDEAYVVEGDSGAPSFVGCDGLLLLVGIHSTNQGNLPLNGVRARDSFIYPFIGQFNAAVDPDYITTATALPFRRLG